MKRIGVVLVGLLLTGCGYEGAQSLPLPGGVSGDTYRVSTVFADATNLVPEVTCRINDTVVGSVDSVELDDQLKARVVCRIKESVTLPANATATLRETSLLGERFVALDPPPGEEPRGVLAPGSAIPEARTRVDPNTEMVLGALSQVLNGGSLGQIQTITQELSVAFAGSDVGGTLDTLGSTVGTLNDRRDSITASLESLARLSNRLAEQRSVIAEALDSIPGGLAALDRQRPRLVRTLRQLSSLSGAVVPLIERSKADVVADLEHLTPVLRALSEEGDELAATLERVATFPFPETALEAIKGDYGGLYATITLDVDAINALLISEGVEPLPAVESPTTNENTSGLPQLLPQLPALDDVMDLLGPALGGGSGGLLGDLLGGTP